MFLFFYLRSTLPPSLPTLLSPPTPSQRSQRCSWLFHGMSHEAWIHPSAESRTCVSYLLPAADTDIICSLLCLFKFPKSSRFTCGTTRYLEPAADLCWYCPNTPKTATKISGPHKWIEHIWQKKHNYANFGAIRQWILLKNRFTSSSMPMCPWPRIHPKMLIKAWSLSSEGSWTQNTYFFWLNKNTWTIVSQDWTRSQSESTHRTHDLSICPTKHL